MVPSFLTIKDVSKRFSGVQALDRVSFKVDQGEIVALIGANGAGKTTLMNILGGIVQKDSGTISINGTKIDIHNPIDADNQGIAFVHQELTALNSLRVIDNLLLTSYPNTLGIIQSRRAAESVKRIFKRLGLNIDPNDQMGNLSPGDQQMVEIARVLLQEARIVIFDEPTSSLSRIEKDRLFEIIKDLKQTGVAVIYITHLLDELKDLCESIVILRNGRLVSEGKLADYTRGRIVKEMVGEETKIVKRKRLSYSKQTPLLKVHGIHRRGVLMDISFEMYQGEILGIWGLMGSGRTELLRSLVGLDPVDKGTLFLQTRDRLKGITPSELRKHVGFITEDRRNEGLFQSMSVRINLTIASLSYLFTRVRPFISSRKEKTTTLDTIARLHIKLSDPDQSVNTLSGGNQQKVVIGRWLLRDPDIYFLDEPIKGIDVASKAEIKQIIDKLADEGKSILLVSSEIEELIGYCDRYLVLCRGRITQELPGQASLNQLMNAATSFKSQQNEGVL